jgi:light-regulated signal transduction histidine kinase (bacteriophytochrome)
MWIGTFDGLNRYDGYNFNVYRQIDNDPRSLPTNIIRSMYKDNNNNLWIGTARGLCLYDRDHDCFINFNKENGYPLEDYSIECLLKDSRGNFWIGMSTLIAWYKIHTARIRAHNRELEQRVAERTAQLEMANKELETFVYSVSHDLQTPLRAIEGYASILLEDHMYSLDEAARRACSVISNEAKHMGHLIEDFLSLSRSRYADMHISLIDMEALVHSVFDELTRTENRERIDFNVAPLPSVYGDPTLFREVWVNLICNAVKFSSKKEHAVIVVNYKQDDQKIIYSVRDNGAGFEMQYADKLFGVFQRLHSKNEFEGTGVGLAIVKRLINRHGGEVWAESQLDKGATFYFTVRTEGDIH